MGQPKEKPTADDAPKFEFPPECIADLGENPDEVWLEGDEAKKFLRTLEAGETWPESSR